MTGRMRNMVSVGPSPMLFVTEKLIGSQTQVASMIAPSASSSPHTPVLASPTMSSFKRRDPYGY
jgi:hypothetical protein